MLHFLGTLTSVDRSLLSRQEFDRTLREKHKPSYLGRPLIALKTRTTNGLKAVACGIAMVTLISMGGCRDGHRRKENEEAESHAKDAEFLNDRATKWLSAGEYDKAIEDSSRSIKIDPNQETPYTLRAAAWLNLGEYDKAIEDSTKAIRIKKNAKTPHTVRGAAFYYKREYD